MLSQNCFSTRTFLLALACTAGMASADTPQVASFKIESAIALSGLQSTVTPAIPANVLASITGGALELRQQITWLPAGSSTGNPSLRVDGFLVAPGSPFPTPPAGQIVQVFSYVVRIDTTVFSTKPFPSVTFLGSVISNDAVSPFGNLIGAQVAISTGYSGDPVTFANVVVLIPGLGTIYAPSARGTLSLVGATTTPTAPPSPSGNRPPVANAGAKFSSTTNQVQLDGSASSDPDGDTLSFSWRIIGRSSEITGSNTAKPIVQLTEGFGDYTFELTVNDGKGGTSTATVTVSYFGQ